MKKIIILCVFIASACLSWATEKSIESMLSDMAGEVGKAYVSPVTDGFCSNMNAGWFNKAPKAKVLGLDIEISVVAMGTMFDDADKTFSKVSDGKVSLTYDMVKELAKKLYGSDNEILAQKIWEQLGGSDNSAASVKVKASGPTVIGSNSDKITLVINENITVDGTSYSLQGQSIETDITGLDLPIIPLGAFQISLGTLFGTKGTFRFLPPVEVDKSIGKVSYYGGALQHNPKMFLPVLDILPFDLDLSGSYQVFKLGDIIKASAWTAGMNVSKQLGWRFLNLTPYAGLMLESSNMEFSYDYTISTGTNTSTKSSISFDVDGPNNYRIPVGLGVRLGILNLSGEYYFAEQSGFSANLALAF